MHRVFSKCYIIILFASAIGLIMAFIIGLYINITRRQETGYINVKPGGSSLYVEYADATVQGFDSYGETHFFIPSYANISRISYDRSDLKIYTPEGKLLTHPEFNTVQDVLVDMEDGTRTEYRIGFYQSQNLHTVYIDTGDTGIEDVDRSSYAQASIEICAPNGSVIYKGQNARIKGRGNTTWTLAIKKSYDIRLAEKVSIMGMEESDKLTLLANAADNTKICNKMVLDAAARLGLEFTSKSEWADVYIDGTYWGNYLICREPDIGEDGVNIDNLQKKNKKYASDVTFEEANMKGYAWEGRPADITGGYLISVEPIHDKSNCGFMLSDGVYFRIKSPNNASREEVEYISSYVSDIDSDIRAHVEATIDKSSFAKRYLIEEVFFNTDAQMASYYFYKKKGDDRLYAGPCWDYDQLYINVEDPTFAYTETILNYDKTRDLIPLEWDKILLEDDAYREFVKATFIENFDIWADLLENGIDDYYDKIKASTDMDYARWSRTNHENALYYGHYDKTGSNIKYLKYAMYRRLLYLVDKWEVPISVPKPELSDGTEHIVRFDDYDAEWHIIDGGEISGEMVPALDTEEYGVWVNGGTNEEIYTELPVYEDITFHVEIEDGDEED